MSIKKKNLKVQKKKERNRTSCKSYYPDEVEETTFGTATEEEQLVLIDISCLRKREDRINQLFSFFPNDIIDDYNGGKIEFTARLINLLCYALGQGRTNVRSCLGSHFKRKGYKNLTVRKKNTGMVFVRNGFVEEKVRKNAKQKQPQDQDQKQKQKQKQKQNQEQGQKQELDQKNKVREQKRRKKRVFVDTLPVVKEEGEKKNENKIRKTNPKTKQTRMTRSRTRTRINTRSSKKAIINPKFSNNTNNSYNTNSSNSNTNSCATNSNTDGSSNCSNNNNDNNKKNNTYNGKSNTNEINDQFEEGLMSPDQDSLLYKSFWVELPQNSNNLESDSLQGFSPVNTSMLSEIQFENEIAEPFGLAMPYQFENEDFSSFLLAIENEFESKNLQFD
ncbi:anillin/rhotekin rtkn [Anaeramoeba flamelloides]|uniref:Anillin/rhotekin rtkn n=1 Tax=Anaeramoeba flamelloides TaxID=1746091 RepID=A0AAV7ZE67_9EUKA|nr:anillin/rhotekin rtkn [Anaeramoeba flamelloides]